MATTFGWKKKIPHDLSRKRAAAFVENEGEEGVTQDKLNKQNLGPPNKLLRSNEDNESVSKRLREEGVLLAEQERFSEAVRKWNNALKITPNNEKLHEMKSQVFLQVDKTFEAIKSAEKAVDLNPRWSSAYQALGRAQLKFGEFDLAVKSFSRAVHLRPDDSELWREDLLWSVDVRKKAHLHDRQLEL